MKSIGGIVASRHRAGNRFVHLQSGIHPGPEGGAPPMQMIDVAGVKSDLIAIGQAERLYHGKPRILRKLGSASTGRRHGVATGPAAAIVTR